MQRARALLRAVTLGAAVGLSAAASAPAQTGLTDTVQQVNPPTVPTTPSVPSTPSIPATTTNQSAPSAPRPTAEDAPKAPTTASPVPGGQSPPSVEPSGGGSGGGGSSSGEGSRGDSSRASPGGSSSRSGSGSPAAASGAGGNAAAGQRGTSAPAAGTRGGPSHAGAFEGMASPRTDASWLEFALDPRYERVFTRRLTETVAELEGCLSALGSRDRRVLTLRAGLDAQRGRSRAAVARRLDLTRTGVAVTEQGALRELLSAARGGACGEGAAAAAAGLASAGTFAAGMSGGWAIDRLRFGSPPPAASDGAPAAGSLGPALLDADPFSRVSIAGATSGPDDGGQVLGIGSWLEALLIALLSGLLALLAWVGIARARRSSREPRARRA